MSWWQHIPEHINPVIVRLGKLEVRYYGLMYVVAFAITYLLVLHRLKKEQYEYTSELIRSYLIWAVLGLLIGGKAGYILFYEYRLLITAPAQLLSRFGMSYHGGFIGVFATTLIFCFKHGISFWQFCDLFSPAIPLGYTFGRIGNFINGELYGRVTTVSWGMYFPLDTAGQLRHPSQLYEAFFEGVLLFIILWSIRKKRVFDGFIFCLYIIGYSIARFCIEFVREPDAGLEMILKYFTRGQILSAGMILVVIAIILFKIIQKNKNSCKLLDETCV